MIQSVCFLQKQFSLSFSAKCPPVNQISFILLNCRKDILSQLCCLYWNKSRVLYEDNNVQCSIVYKISEIVSCNCLWQDHSRQLNKTVFHWFYYFRIKIINSQSAVNLLLRMLVILLSATSTTEYQGIIALKLFKGSNFLFQVDKVEVGDGSPHYLAGTTVRVHVVRCPGLSLSIYTLQVGLHLLLCTLTCILLTP